MQNEVNGRPQEMSSVGPNHQRIYRLQGTVGQFHVVDHHDNWNLRPDAFELRRNNRTIEEVDFMLEHNGIHGARHQKPQTIRTVAGGQ